MHTVDGGRASEPVPTQKAKGKWEQPRELIIHKQRCLQRVGGWQCVKKHFRRWWGEGGGSTGEIVSVTGTGSGERSLCDLVKDVSVSTHRQFGWAFSGSASPFLVMFWAWIGRKPTWTCPTGHLFDCSAGEMTENGGGTVTGARKDGGELKIVIVGDGGCGKTSLLMVYAKGDFPEVRTVTD